MGAWKVDGPGGETIESVPQMFGRFSGQVLAKTCDWQKRLHEQPEELEVIEREVRQEFMRGADLMVAALAAVVMASSELAASSEQLGPTMASRWQKVANDRSASSCSAA